MDADASMCRDGSLPSVPPASLPILTDKAAACGGRNVPSGRCSARPEARPLRSGFCIGLTDFKVDWSKVPVSVATWIAQLYTKATGHPLPVARYARGAVCLS